MSLMEEIDNTSVTLTAETTLSNGNSPSVIELTQQLTEYKMSVYIFTYATIPVALWGWMGNFLSFR